MSAILFALAWLVVAAVALFVDDNMVLFAAAGICCNVWVVCARLERKLGARP